MRIKVELAPRPRLLMTQPGDAIGGQVIAYTHPGDPHAVVDVPDTWSPAEIDAWARGLEASGLLHNDGELWRPEKTLTVLWLPAPLEAGALWTAGDTFLGLGITPETQARGNWGRGVKVALLDTGLDGDHPWFATMRAERRLFGDLQDSHGHGTHCGGTITGQYGVAPGATLSVWNVLPGGSGSESGIADGIDRAVQWGAQVISMSLGGAGSSAIINGAVQRARQAGVLVSSAAGNGSSQGPVGSPAMASSFCVMAYGRNDPPQWAPFTDGRYSTDANLPRVARPGVEVVSAMPGGGTQAMSGTSMACPHNTGFAALLLGAGLSGAQVEQYVWSHLGAAPEGRTAMLRPDFGAGEGPPPALPPPSDDLEQARAELAQVIALQDDARYINRDADPDFAWTEIGEASRIAAIVRDRLAPKVPPPPVDPPPLPRPSTLTGVYGTYSGHGLAVDLYGGMTDEQVQWGPHHGVPIVAPADGRVEVYQFGTPLLHEQASANGVSTDAFAAAWHALFSEWTCWVPLQTMYVAVFWPTAPYLYIEAYSVAHLHYGHVRSNIKAGPVRKGEQFATSWNSGIQFEPGNPVARAAHTHCCAGAGTQLSPNGDLPGRLAVVAQGWAPVTDIGTVPGPTDYQVPRLYCAGRRYQDFLSAGRPVPPMPS